MREWHELCFFDKIEGCALQAAALSKRWPTIDSFSKKIFPLFILFKAASFRYTFQKEYLVSSPYSKVAVWKLQSCNFTERNSIIEVFLNSFETSTFNNFLYYHQLCWRSKLRERSHWAPLNIKHLLESSRRNRTVH